MSSPDPTPISRYTSEVVGAERPVATVREIAKRARVSVGVVSRVLNNHHGVSEDTRNRVMTAATELGYSKKARSSNGSERVGLTDIARRSGVSLGSVSRALKGSPGVSQETRQRVLEAAQALGYNTQNLRQGSITRVGFLIHRGVNALAHNPFYAPVLHGAEEACRNLKLAISYTTVGPEDNVPELIQQQQVDGLLCIGYFEPHLMGQFQATGKPIVLVDHHVAGLPSVNSDNRGGAQQAVQHLIELGRKRIAYIAGPLEHYSIRERQHGYRQALYQARILADPNLEVSYSFDDELGAKQAMQQLLQLSEPPDAVFAFNDATAMDAIQVCQEMGLKVPQDLAVVGFDDVGAAAYFNPPLSTIQVPKEALGSKGVELLLDLKNNKPGVSLTVPTQLIVRGSSQTTSTNATERRARRAR